LLALESGEPTGLLQIRLRATGVAIGSIGFKGEQLIGNVRAAEIGYQLVPSAQGQGFGTEAVGALLQIARDRGIQYLCADTQVNNAASQEILTTYKFVEASRDDRSIWWLLAL
jgi:RimJ/RimL family protein N-acetyltransferase